MPAPTGHRTPCLSRSPYLLATLTVAHASAAQSAAPCAMSCNATATCADLFSISTCNDTLSLLLAGLHRCSCDLCCQPTLAPLPYRPPAPSLPTPATPHGEDGSGSGQTAMVFTLLVVACILAVGCTRRIYTLPTLRVCWQRRYRKTTRTEMPSAPQHCYSPKGSNTHQSIWSGIEIDSTPPRSLQAPSSASQSQCPSPAGSQPAHSAFPRSPSTGWAHGEKVTLDHMVVDSGAEIID